MPSREADMLQSFSTKRLSNELSLKFAKQLSNEYPELGFLRPKSYFNAFKKLKNNTSAGLPSMSSKLKWKEKFINFLVLQYPGMDFDSAAQQYYVDSANKNSYAIVFTRTQENEKTRNVWGYPADRVLLEQRYYIPLLEEQKERSWRSALSDADDIDLQVTFLMDQAKNMGRTLVSVDFKSFDNSVSPELISRSFDLVRALFQPGEIFDFEMNEISKDFQSMPIYTPFRIFKGYHGVPSGSTFTNEIDSLVQFGVAKASGVVGELCQVQGDDGLYTIESKDYKTLIKTFENYGLNLSTDKSLTSDEHCTFLQKLYHPDFRKQNGIIPGVYSTYRALIRLVYPEREPEFGKLKSAGVSLADYNRIRSIQILENCKNHPLHEDLVYFVDDLWSEEGLKVNDAAVEMYSVATVNEDQSFKTQQYGGDLTGWNNFETVKLLNNRINLQS